jgi:hypothetical protein
MSNQFEILEFFREVQRVISKHGLPKVLCELRKLKIDSNDNFERDTSDYILNITSKHYKIEINDILSSKKRGIISESRRMCFALMKEHLQFTDEEIGHYFGGRSRQFVNKELISLPINKENLWKKRDLKFLEDFMLLTTNVLNYKNSYNVNNKMKENE